VKPKAIGDLVVVGTDIYLAGSENPSRSAVCQLMDVATLRVFAKFPVPSDYSDESERAIYYYADKQRMYIAMPGCYIEEIPGANPDDFRIFEKNSPRFSCSGGQYLQHYYQASPISYDPRAAQLLGGYYVRHLDTIYHCFTDEVAGADAATFTVLHGDVVGHVAKDAKHVYFRDAVVEGADAATFTFLPACVANDRAYYCDWDVCFYAKDKHRAYWVCTTSDAIKPIATKSLDRFSFYVDPKRKDYGFARDDLYEYNAGVRKRLKPT
jgi:DKNYY family